MDGSSLSLHSLSIRAFQSLAITWGELADAFLFLFLFFFLKKKIPGRTYERFPFLPSAHSLGGLRASWLVASSREACWCVMCGGCVDPCVFFFLHCNMDLDLGRQSKVVQASWWLLDYAILSDSGLDIVSKSRHRWVLRFESGLKEGGLFPFYTLELPTMNRPRRIWD